MDKIDLEYHQLLKRHLDRAYKELQELRKKTDKKIIEINEIEELIEMIESREEYKNGGKIRNLRQELQRERLDC